jgi:uncharacterized SAM-binding protein YcdF (DUF218 family)
VSEHATPPSRRLLAAGMAALILVAALIIFNLMLIVLGGILIIADPLEPSAVVVVLSGGRGDRLEEAARILQEKNAGSLLLTHPSPEVEDANTSAVRRQAALEAGISAEAIQVTGEHSNSTYAEALEIRRYLEEKGISSALIVTDPFHSFRTRLIFHEVFKDSTVGINVRPVRNHWYRSTTWWTTAEGWTITFTEYAKLAAYLVGIRRD